jgi:soluble cytochrome b562
MRRVAQVFSVVAVAAALPMMFLASALGRDDDKEEKEKLQKTAAAQVDVLKLVDALGGKEDDVQKQAEEIARKHEIAFVMNQFKPRDKGGVGVGKPGAFVFDGIEQELLAIGKKPLTPDKAAAQKADLHRMAQVMLAVAYIAPSYCPKTDEPGKPIKDWMRLADDMKKQSKELAEAIQNGDPKTVKTAAARLNRTCETCHSEFRDN